MSVSVLFAMAALAALFSLPIVGFAFYYRSKKNEGLEYGDRIVWPLWVGFGTIPVMFFYLVGNFYGPSSSSVDYVSNEFEMIEADAGPDEGIVIKNIKPSQFSVFGESIVQTIKRNKPFSQSYGMVTSASIVTISGVPVLKYSVRYNSETVGLVFVEVRSSRIFNLYCMRMNLTQLISTELEQCEEKLIAGRKKLAGTN